MFCKVGGESSLGREDAEAGGEESGCDGGGDRADPDSLHKCQELVVTSEHRQP